MFANTTQFEAAAADVVADARNLKVSFELPTAVALNMAIATAETAATALDSKIWNVAHIEIEMFEGVAVKPVLHRGEVAHEAKTDSKFYDSLADMVEA